MTADENLLEHYRRMKNSPNYQIHVSSNAFHLAPKIGDVIMLCMCKSGLKIMSIYAVGGLDFGRLKINAVYILCMHKSGPKMMKIDAIGGLDQTAEVFSEELEMDAIFIFYVWTLSPPPVFLNTTRAPSVLR